MCSSKLNRLVILAAAATILGSTALGVPALISTFTVLRPAGDGSAGGVLTAACGTGGINTVDAVGEACLQYTIDSEGGYEIWEIAEGETYEVTLTGVTECSDEQIEVIVHSPQLGDYCTTATKKGDGMYIFVYIAPPECCGVLTVYYCTSDCVPETGYLARDNQQYCPGRLRFAFFDDGCEVTGTDTCGGCIIQCSGDITVDCLCEGGAVVTWPEPNVFNGTFLRCQPPSGSRFPTGETTVECTAVDPNGVECTCSFKVIVNQDTTPPEFTCPGPDPIDLGCAPPALPDCDSVKALITDLADDCDADPALDCTTDGPQGGPCAWSQTFTLTATDRCQNKSEPCIVKYTWTTDTQPPTFTCPSGEGGELGCNPPALPSCDSVKALVTDLNDNCDTSPTLNCTTSGPTGGPCTWSQAFTLTAVDDCQNASPPCELKYTWTIDAAAPTFTCPAGVDLGCNPTTLPDCDSVKARVTDLADNCTATPTLDCTTSGPTGGPCAWTQTFTLTAADGCQNTSEPCTVQYSWTTDTLAPTFTCPESQGGELGCNPPALPTCDSVKALVSDLADNCDASPTLQCFTAGPQGGPCRWTQTFQLTAIDDCGNASAPCSVRYSWTADTQPPAITCPTNITHVGCEDCPTDPNLTGWATAADNCGGAPIITYRDLVEGTCPRLITRTWTATDACGNQATCRQTIACLPPSLMTNTERCTFGYVNCDRDPNTMDFRLIFLGEGACYRLGASNPGQYYYNVFAAGTPGEAAVFNLSIPYPFETQGTNAVHVYDSLTLSMANGEPCLSPGGELVATGAYNFAVPCGGKYPQPPRQFSVPVVFPASGFVFLTVHLDYGLKDCPGFQKNTRLDAVRCGYPTTVLIPNGTPHRFVVSGYEVDEDVVYNCNEFKNPKAEQ